MTNLLFVDDNEMLRTFAARNLESDIPELSVVVAGSCQEARRRAIEQRPDVVVLDQQLTDGLGLELLQEMRQQFPGASVLIATAETGAAIRQRAERAGAFDVLVKPYDIDLLVDSVRRALAAAETASAEANVEAPSGCSDVPGPAVTEPWRSPRHLALNQLSILVAGLRAFEVDLEVCVDDPKAIREAMELYIPRLVGVVLETAELLRAQAKSEGDQ